MNDMDTTTSSSSSSLALQSQTTAAAAAFLSRSPQILQHHHFDTNNNNNLIQDIAPKIISPQTQPPPPSSTLYLSESTLLSPSSSSSSSSSISETSTLLSLASMTTTPTPTILISTGNNLKKFQEEIQQQQHQQHSQRNYMMIPMMMFSSSNHNNYHHPHHPHHQHHQSATHYSQMDDLTSTNISNLNFTMPHFLTTDDIAYSHDHHHHSIDHEKILMSHHHHRNMNQSSTTIFNREQFPTIYDNHHNQLKDSESPSVIDLTTTSSTLTSSIGQIPPHQIPPHPTIFNHHLNHHHHLNSPFSPSSVISTIGTSPPINHFNHNNNNNNNQQQKQLSPKHHHTSNNNLNKLIKKMTNAKKISRNDSTNSSTSSSSTKSNGHNQQCKVCGDIPIGKNFGVVTCGSCKIFFSRNIDCKEKLQCRNNNRCMDLINKSNRRNCSACRLDKCIRLGMRVKRNRQKNQPSNTATKIKKNSNDLSINGNVVNDQSHCSDDDDVDMINQQEETNQEIDQINDDDDDDDYNDIPSLVPIEQISSSSPSSSSSSMSNEFNSNNNENCILQSNYHLINRVSNHNDNGNKNQSIINQSINQPPIKQPLFNSVSVIQQAPPSRPSSTLIVSPNLQTEENTVQNVTKQNESDSKSDETIKEKKFSNINDDNEKNKMLMVPYQQSSLNKMMIVDDDDEEEDDIESLEEKTHDGFNYSYVRSSINDDQHTRYNYSNFYDENYYKYYYFPPNYYNNTNDNNDYNNNDDYNDYNYNNNFNNSNTNTNNQLSFDDDLINNQISSTSSSTSISNNNIVSVELCKVEARNFGDQDHALIADLEKWQPYIRIHMGLDYTTNAPPSPPTSSSLYCNQTNFNVTMIDGFVSGDEQNYYYYQHKHKLFPKELKQIEYLNSSCRMISAKPQSNDQLRAIFDSLERGIFYANKSFKLYDEFWCESEISELIRQNETGFIKKKNNLLHMLYHLRGVQNFDDNLNAWAIFNGVNDNGFTMVKLDMFQQSIKKEMAVAHRQYISSFPQEWRKDPTVFNLMTYLLMFGAFDRPHSPFKCDKLTYFRYLYLFKRYFECMYQDEEQAQQMLLWMLKLIRQLSPLCSECLTACTHSLNPAVLKKIGPNYAQCLMMEEKSKPATSCCASTNMQKLTNDDNRINNEDEQKFSNNSN